jgi:hypothetical protein
MKKIIGIVGFKNSGKDTAAQAMIQQGYKKYSFAGSLKDACASIFCWDRTMLEGETASARAQREIVDTWWADKLGIRDWSPRKALQIVGTEIFRENLHQTIWALSIERRIMTSHTDIVLTDARFHNEISLLKKYGGKIIRIKRGDDPEWFDTISQYNNLIYNGFIPENPDLITEQAKPLLEEIHASERDWIGSDFDCVIENDGTISDLHNKVNDYLKQN